MYEVLFPLLSTISSMLTQSAQIEIISVFRSSFDSLFFRGLALLVSELALLLALLAILQISCSIWILPKVG